MRLLKQSLPLTMLFLQVLFIRVLFRGIKNALDNLDYHSFGDKAVGLFSHGSTAKNALLSCEYLGTVVHTLYGQALQCQVASAKDDFASENENHTWRLSSEDAQARCTYLADETYYRF